MGVLLSEMWLKWIWNIDKDNTFDPCLDLDQFFIFFIFFLGLIGLLGPFMFMVNKY